MIERKQLTQEFVKSLFDYHKEGYLIWKIKTRMNVDIGDKAGCVGKNDERRTVGIKNKNYLAARIIFLWHKGYLPEIVDHKDRDSLNDKIENLRATSYSQNATNSRHIENKSSKYRGVCYSKALKKWLGYIYFNYKKISLGSFINEEEAGMAYNEAAKRIHGEFANLNNIIQCAT
jgi:hypothetical protein